MKAVLRGAVLTAVAVLSLATASTGYADTSSRATGAREETVTIDGVPARIVVPANWNGTLLLYSHGFRAYGGANPATATPSGLEADGPAIQSLLTGQGYALAGSAFRTTGFAHKDALVDQVKLLDWFARHVAKPKRTYSWGDSYGGQLSVLLAERNAQRIHGVLSLCGPVGGAVNQERLRLDTAYAIKTLLAPELELNGIADPAANQAAADAAIDTARRGTPQSKAKLALAAALGNIAPQFDGHAPAAPESLDEALVHLGVYLRFIVSPGAFGPQRAAHEERLGGTPAGNTGVDYRTVLARSSQRELVERAYAAAGLDLDADLAALDAGDRVAADPDAVRYQLRYGQPTGYTPFPVFTVHTTLDGTVPVEHHRWYADAVARVGQPENLRQAYLARGYHCSISAAEIGAAFAALDTRVRTRSWGDTGPAALNAAAARYPDAQRQVFSYWAFDGTPGSGWAALEPGFTDHRPGLLPRPFPF
ncbi:MAG: alpha/beta hydrolase family protein [Micromonosporaceae bacterium]